MNRKNRLIAENGSGTSECSYLRRIIVAIFHRNISLLWWIFSVRGRGSQVDQKSSLCSPPLRSPHRHNYTAPHSAPPRPVCKHCHLLLDNENVPAAGAEQFTWSRRDGPTQFNIRCALQTAAITFHVQFSAWSHSLLQL